MRYKLTIVLVIAITLMAAGLTMLFYSFYTFASIEKIPIELTVAENPGINVDTDALRFGDVPRGNSATRSIALKNKRDVFLEARITKTGELADWVILEKETVILNPLQQLNVSASAHVPEDAEYGKYSGEIIIFFKALD